MQQALGYARCLDIPFVYSSNGDAFLEHDKTVTSGKIEKEIPLDAFPSPLALWKSFTSIQLSGCQMVFLNHIRELKPIYYFLKKTAPQRKYGILSTRFPRGIKNTPKQNRYNIRNLNLRKNGGTNGKRISMPGK